MSQPRIVAVRGATTVDSDSAVDIFPRVQEMLTAMLSRNEIQHDDVISAFFTATPDLTSVFPAAAAREIGFGDIPLIYVVHDVAAPAECADGHAAADDLAQRGEVGLDAVQALSALRTDAEAGHHFVEYQHRAVLGAQLAQRTQELRFGCDEVHVAGHRLDDDTGDLVALVLEQVLQFRAVVVGQHQRVLRHFRRYAG